MSKPIVFGTDGWRGIIAEDFTFERVRLCTQGLTQYLIEQGIRQEELVIGYNDRFASEHFATAVAEVLAGNGVGVYLFRQAVPTPLVSYAICAKKAAGGVIITASHNPARDNGFKIRLSHGEAANPGVLREIEQHIHHCQSGGEVKRIPYKDGVSRGLIKIFDPGPEYLSHLSTLVDAKAISAAGLSIVVDAMWGAGAGWIHRILSGGSTQVFEIRNERNPLFPGIKQPEPVPTNLEALFTEVQRVGADVGLATDGDADRLGVCNEHSNFVNNHQVYALLTLYLLEVLGWHGPIVKTVSTTSMLDRLGKIYGIPVYEVGVGFKYVGPKMIEVQAIIGGEESGGYAFRGHIPERDAILSGLFLLDMMVKLGKLPSELVARLFNLVGPHYYCRNDIPLKGRERNDIVSQLEVVKPQEIAGLKVIGRNTLDGYKYYLADGGWLLIRLSGTEPLVRVYVETTRADRVEKILTRGLELIGVQS